MITKDDAIKKLESIEDRLTKLGEELLQLGLDLNDEDTPGKPEARVKLASLIYGIGEGLSHRAMNLCQLRSQMRYGRFDKIDPEPVRQLCTVEIRKRGVVALVDPQGGLIVTFYAGHTNVDSRLRAARDWAGFNGWVIDNLDYEQLVVSKPVQASKGGE